MKKLSFFLMAMLVSLTSFATEVSIDLSAQGYDNAQEITSVSLDDAVTVAFDKGTNNNTPKYYNTGKAVRVYGGGYFTITTTTGQLTKIDLTFSTGEGANEITVDAGSYATGTWTGQAGTVKFTVGGTTGHRRIQKIVVTYEAATDPDAVIYEVAAEECTVGEGYGTVSGTGNYAEGSTVTLTAKPNPGYVFDSWDNGSKENPLTLTVTGYIYQCATFIPQTPITIAEALQLADGETGVLNYFTVSYVNGANIYIEDESGYALAYKYDYGLKAGDGVNFMAFTKSTHNGIPQLVPETAYEKLTIIPGEAPAIAEITSAPTVADNHLVKLMNASLAGPLAVKSTTVATCADESTINIYSQIDFTPEEGKTYNILGSVTQYKGVIQIQAYEVEEYVAPVVNYNIYLTAAPSEGGEVEGEGEFEAGEQVTVSALANEGYEFVNWTEGEEVVSTNANYTFEVTAERDLVANFQLMSETVYFINNDNWEGDIYAYAWKEGGEENHEWPGVLAEKLATPYEGFEEYTAYSYTALHGQYDYVIFTNGQDQTIEHPWVGNAFYYIEKGPAVEPTEVTVYCINSAKWDVVACHHWVEEGSSTTWPGDEMTKTGETVNGFDVYAATFTIEHTSCIFNNNGNGSQTGNLTVANGHYYYVKDSKWYASLADVPALDPLATDVYLAGDMNGWSTVANEFRKATEDATTASLALTLEAATTYEFKVVKEGAWLGNNGTITETVEGWTFKTGTNNCKLTTDAAGEYVLTWDLNTDKLSVTYPEIPTYTVTLLNDAGAELEGAGEYVEGSVATVIAPEMDGWYFVAWTDEEGMVISNDATTTVTVNQDITLTALYAMMMPLEVSDLEIIMDPVVGLIGSTDLGGGTLSLQLVVDAYAEPGEDGEFPLTEDSQIWLGEEMQFEFLEGIAFIDLENNTAQAIVLAADEWGMIYYFVIEMSAAAPAEPIVVVVENATLDDQVESTGFFYMAGECTIDGVIYPVKAEIPSLDKTIAEAEYEYVMVEVGTWGGEYLGNATGTATVSIVDNVVILTGVIENPMTHVAFDVTISGTLPAEEPEGPATGLDNINTTVAPVKAIVNGQLVIVKDGVKYNVQGAVL